jgi:transcriptional regulator with XRE-family HTH domain
MPAPRRRFRDGWTYEDLARELGMTEAAVRVAVHRGKFDPDSIDSITEYWISRSGGFGVSPSLRELVAEARALLGRRYR